MRDISRLGFSVLCLALLLTATPAFAQAGAPTTDAEFEEFLATAEIVSKKKVGTGVTNPDKLTLRQGDVEMHAVYKNVDSMARGITISGIATSDRYTYDVAAYRLDRLIGLHMVPVAVVRRVDGKTGVVQRWIEDTFDEGDRIDGGKNPPDKSAFDTQVNRMRVFDVLIFNSDRNMGNILYEESDWTVHLIDHSRAFRLNRDRPKHLSKVELHPAPELVEGLRSLDKKMLREALGGLIQSAQIGAILKRRDQLLKEWEK